jgi:hypothetical protein
VSSKYESFKTKVAICKERINVLLTISFTTNNLDSDEFRISLIICYSAFSINAISEFLIGHGGGAKHTTKYVILVATKIQRVSQFSLYIPNYLHILTAGQNANTHKYVRICDANCSDGGSDGSLDMS